MELINVLIIIFLILAALYIERTKDLLAAIIIFSAYSLAMSLLWLFLRTPDIALTEAAIGAGVTTVLFVAVLARTKRLEK
jgi:energy-converting hydrogenase B subunit D